MDNRVQPLVNEYGLTKGEKCGRDGCEGIIEEYPKDGSCSCHNNPPCAYCTTDTSFCPECGWEHEDEIVPIDPEIEKKKKEYYANEMKRFQEKRESFYKMFNTGEGIDELSMRTEGHTHFTQKVIGVFPHGTESRSSIEPIVKGTFGGRFTRFEDFRFEYIAYTD